MTYLDLLKSSLRLAGHLKPGQGPSASETIDAQFVLNAFLDACNAEGLNIYTTQIAQYATVASQQIHTIGVGGTWVADRPAKLVRANVLMGTSPAIRRKIKILTDEEWGAKQIQAVTSIPREIYSDGGFPLTSLYFYPIPDTIYQIELYTWQLLQQVSSLAATVTLPPGYADFIRYNFAVRIAPEWGLKLRPDVVELARTSKAAIQSMNVSAPALKTEPGLSGRGRTFNYLTRELN